MPLLRGVRAYSFIITRKRRGLTFEQGKKKNTSSSIVARL